MTIKYNASNSIAKSTQSNDMEIRKNLHLNELFLTFKLLAAIIGGLFICIYNELCVYRMILCPLLRAYRINDIITSNICLANDVFGATLLGRSFSVREDTSNQQNTPKSIKLNPQKYYQAASS